MDGEQRDMFQEPQVPDHPTTATAHPDDEPTIKQAVNAIVWTINKLSAEIVRFSGGMETRAGRIEERLGNIEESLALLHEERGRAARPGERKTRR